MALRKLYQKFREEWKDKPDKTTPVTAEALNHIEQGIYDNSNRMALKEIYGDDSLNLEGKARISNDVTTDEHSLSGLGASLISTSVDISDECTVNINGQTLEITAPIDAIMLNAPFLGGCYIGWINFRSAPSYILRAQISYKYIPSPASEGIVKLIIVANQPGSSFAVN